MNTHEKYPVGTQVRYLGGDETTGEMLEVGQIYTITEHDLFLSQEVAGFSVGYFEDTPGEQFYAIVSEDFLVKANDMYFSIIYQ